MIIKTSEDLQQDMSKNADDTYLLNNFSKSLSRAWNMNPAGDTYSYVAKRNAKYKEAVLHNPEIHNVFPKLIAASVYEYLFSLTFLLTSLTHFLILPIRDTEYIHNGNFKEIK